ncbi:MAG: protein kinase domain-containing protein [Gemmatimonadales bacterium]
MNDRRQDLANGLSGRYAIERELGHGGMATVWLARDLRYDRLVALKVLRPELAASLGAERFLREIMLAARLQHPHVVSVYDSGEIEAARPSGVPTLWFTMPYIEGESLRERLRREGALPKEEALRIARQVSRGLQYAHEHGVIHRDVKPENILLTRDGSTLVADFGIARPTGTPSSPHLTGTGVVIGTPVYMSPEQATGAADLDARTDIYALACVLYEMLTGQPPFTGATVQVIVAKHLTEQPAFTGSASEAIPDSVKPVLARALAKSPAERPASAAEFSAALEVENRPPASSLRPALTAAAAVIVGGLIGLVALRAAGRGSPEQAAAAPAGGTVASGFARKLAQLSFGEGLEEWPAWSPDGKSLAYVAEVEGFRQLFVRPMAGGGERQLTKGARDHIQPAWSPDGARLAFVRGANATGKLEPSEVDGAYFEGGELWTMELATGQETKLFENGFNPSYSPDGQRLAFDAPLTGGQRVWVSDTRGRNPRQVTSDSSETVVHTQARWSPDGSKLVFRRIEKLQSDIAVAEPGSQTIVRVTDDYIFDLDPAWAPDGRAIYFSSSRGGGVNLWRVPVSPEGAPAGPAEQLTTGAGDDVQPTLHPDGRRLVFAVRGINADLWRLPVAPESGRTTGAPEPVLSTTRVESRGAWSPDGRSLAFNSDRSGEMNVWLRDPSGDERRITSGAGGDYQPTWSPDGTSLVFFSARGGNTDIWLVRLGDSTLTRLTRHPALDINPFFSPDGRRIGFVSDRSGRAEVWIMEADGSGQRQLASVGCWGHFLIWTGDSRAIVFRGERDRQMQIYRVAVEDGALTPLRPVMSGGHMSFSPSRSLILDVGSHKVLRVHPVDGRPPYQVYQFADPDVRIDYPRWSPDGRWVVFDRTAPRGGDLWTLEGF